MQSFSQTTPLSLQHPNNFNYQLSFKNAEVFRDQEQASESYRPSEQHMQPQQFQSSQPMLRQSQTTKHSRIKNVTSIKERLQQHIQELSENPTAPSTQALLEKNHLHTQQRQSMLQNAIDNQSGARLQNYQINQKHAERFVDSLKVGLKKRAETASKQRKKRAEYAMATASYKVFPDQPLSTEKFVKEMGLHKVPKDQKGHGSQTARSGSQIMRGITQASSSINFATDIYNQGGQPFASITSNKQKRLIKKLKMNIVGTRAQQRSLSSCSSAPSLPPVNLITHNTKKPSVGIPLETQPVGNGSISQTQLKRVQSALPRQSSGGVTRLLSPKSSNKYSQPGLQPRLNSATSSNHNNRSRANQQMVLSYNSSPKVTEIAKMPSNQNLIMIQSPGRVIDELKFEVKQIEKHSDSVKKEVMRLEETFQVKNKKKELIDKQTFKATQDKQELMRDLSTYESIFACKQLEILKLNLTSIQRRIQGTQQTLMHNPRMLKANGWITNDQISEIWSLLTQKGLFKMQDDKSPGPKKRSAAQSTANVGNFQMFDVNKRRLNRTNTIGNQQKQEMTDSFKGRRSVSGILCMIQAQYVAGFVQGSLSSSRSTKNHQFKFLPFKRTRGMEDELDRLYFENFVNQNGKNHIKLMVVKESEVSLDYFSNNSNQQEQEYRFLAKIKGTQSSFVSMKINVLQDKKQVSVSIVPQSIDCGPLFFVTEIEKIAKIVNKSADQMTLQEIAKILENELICFQDPQGFYQLDKIEDALAKYYKWQLKIRDVLTRQQQKEKADSQKANQNNWKFKKSPSLRHIEQGIKAKDKENEELETQLKQKHAQIHSSIMMIGQQSGRIILDKNKVQNEKRSELLEVMKKCGTVYGLVMSHKSSYSQSQLNTTSELNYLSSSNTSPLQNISPPIFDSKTQSPHMRHEGDASRQILSKSEFNVAITEQSEDKESPPQSGNLKTYKEKAGDSNLTFIRHSQEQSEQIGTTSSHKQKTEIEDDSEVTSSDSELESHQNFQAKNNKQSGKQEQQPPDASNTSKSCNSQLSADSAELAGKRRTSQLISKQAPQSKSGTSVSHSDESQAKQSGHSESSSVESASSFLLSQQSSSELELNNDKNVKAVDAKEPSFNSQVNLIIDNNNTGIDIQYRQIDVDRFDMEFYHILYLKRYIDNFRVFEQIRMNRERSQKLELLFLNEQRHYMHKHLSRYHHQIQLKQIVDLNIADPGKSYFRKAKPIYKQFVQELRKQEAVIGEEVIELQNSHKVIPEGKFVKLMFYKDQQNKLQMMIGIGKNNESLSDEEENTQTVYETSQVLNSQNSLSKQNDVSSRQPNSPNKSPVQPSSSTRVITGKEIAKTQTLNYQQKILQPQKVLQSELREDERYFVTVEIEDSFLRYLDDPEFIEPIDCVTKIGKLIQCYAFLEEVVRKEIKLRKKSEKDKLVQRQAQLAKQAKKYGGSPMHSARVVREESQNDDDFSKSSKHFGSQKLGTPNLKPERHVSSPSQVSKNLNKMKHTDAYQQHLQEIEDNQMSGSQNDDFSDSLSASSRFTMNQCDNNDEPWLRFIKLSKANRKYDVYSQILNCQ